MLSGVLFAVLFVAGIMAAGGEPNNEDPVAAWIEWATDDTRGSLALLSSYLFVGAAFSLVVFSDALASRVAAVAGGLHRVRSFGLLAAAQLALGGILLNAGPVAYALDDGEFGEPPLPTDNFLYFQISTVAYMLIFVGMALALAAMIALTASGLRFVRGRWFIGFGYAVAVALLAGIAFVPILLAPVWAVVAAVALFRDPLHHPPDSSTPGGGGSLRPREWS
jgi:hypothetical protein